MTKSFPFFRILLLFLLTLPLGESVAQVLTGHVVDDETGAPLYKVSVYFEGTSMGTTTDTTGRFRLRTTANNPVPLILSSIGYATISMPQPAIDQVLEVRMKKKAVEMKAIMLEFDGKTREEKEDIFLTEFLGKRSTRNGATIENLDDIDLFYSKSTNTLTASCDNPVRVSNPFIGYKLEYTLEHFSTNSASSSFRGYPLFVEWENVPGYTRKQILKNREKLYDGSRMQFIRTIFSGNLKGSKISVYDRFMQPLKIDELLVEKDGNKYLKVAGPITVQYKDTATHISPKSGETLVSIDERGYFSSTTINWSGDMATQRIASQLPYDYQPD